MTISHIKPDSWLFLRLPSNTLKCLQLKPNTIIEVGRLGSFPSNLLLGRPYYFTHEILEKREGEAYSRLRVVSPGELNAEVVAEDTTPAESRGEPATPGDDDIEAVLAETKNNRLTIDAPSRQTLTHVEIEELKKTAAGQDVIDKILANHGALDEKTAFSRAKYMVRKRSKYLKRFAVLPMEIGTLIEWLFEKEPGRIMDMREETLGLITAWSHAHVTPRDEEVGRREAGKETAQGRWLVVDDAGGLVVAALAERMGLLHNLELEDDEREQTHTANGDDCDVEMTTESAAPPNSTPATNGTSTKSATPAAHLEFPLPASTNSITLLHPAVQPNLSLLKHFGYDTNTPDPFHPLHTQLKTLSWLQLLHPDEDPTYTKPPIVLESTLKDWKSGKRGAYWKKRRRWARCKAVVNEARQGAFDGLVIASHVDYTGILQHLVPLVRGGGHVVLYAPTAEPLVKVMDLYSKERRSAFTALLAKYPGTPADAINKDDFPLDPRLLLAPTLQTSRVRDWQVLPGRTHPVMTSRGGGEGYVFTARKVVPLAGGVEARGNYTGSRKRKAGVAVAGAEGGDGGK
ncbi:tRNA (adenine(58)-N(1))-methyltransferase non-catalytic subunit trm6 [Teratosphaeriaceae sp. CCFEE 6253]|nr:tRNA (adenine(58)-N(1))-methyltransferase non-catalytic subunit trm6 [Teratosphaeriaceae sp. CCFEE 6253]